MKNAVSNFKSAGDHTAELTHSVKGIVRKFDQGNGLAPKLFTDTTLANQLTSSLSQLQDASNKTSVIMDDLKMVIDQMNQGKGTAGLILKDTILRESLFRSASNIEQGTDRFNQNMEALKGNFLFRRYFKKLEKRERENAKASRN